MTLYHANKEEKYTIISIPNVPLLQFLGIREGLNIQIKNKQPLGGPIVLETGTRNIAIGRLIANQIMVEVL